MIIIVTIIFRPVGVTKDNTNDINNYEKSLVMFIMRGKKELGQKWFYDSKNNTSNANKESNNKKKSTIIKTVMIFFQTSTNI